MRTAKYVACILLVVLIQSCRKFDFFNHGTKVDLLKKEVYYVSAIPGYRTVKEFQYDNLKRCTTIVVSKIDSANNILAPQTIFILTMKYTGSSMQPYEIDQASSFNPQRPKKFYLTYDLDGRKLLDSTREKNFEGEEIYRLNIYEYKPNRVISTPYISKGSKNYASYDTLDLQGQNIHRLATFYPDDNGGFWVAQTYTFDNKKNPYSQLNIANALYFMNSTIGMGYNLPQEMHYIGLNKNNMRTIIVSTVEEDGLVTIDYTYNNDGYPTKKTMGFDGAEQKEFYEFEYY